MADITRRCWCGSDTLRNFGPDYLLCTSCETLVGQAGLTDAETRVRNDGKDYYGKRYWLEHQRDALGLPDIYARVRQDLPERCVHWLKTLLRYRQAPAKVLEVGAGHGAYTALLRWAGYNATALDLSSWVAEFAKSRFGVPYLVGPVEEQKLRARSFDVVVANDLLEHLADPRTTLRRCVELLKPEGVLVIQTPEYESGRTYDELVAEDNPFLQHMRRVRTEHLYLFSRNALELLLAELGVGYHAFEEPVYPYDMICVASRTELRRTEGEPSSLLGAGKSGLLVLALIDAHDAWQRSERDGADRLVAVERLDRALKESEADRAARLEAMERLDAALKESETDRVARLKAVKRLEGELKNSEADRVARLEAMERLEAALKESEADRAARLEIIERLEAALKESEADRAARLEIIERLEAALKESEADRAARLEIIERLDAALKESEAGRSAEATKRFETGEPLAKKNR